MIVVTGGAGFIGSALVHGLNLRGEDEILVVDRIDDPEKERNLAPLRHRGVEGIDEFRARVERGGLPKGVRAVLHMGAISRTTEFDEDLLERYNTSYTRVLCEAALEAGARFIYASSAATYGDGSRGFDDDVAALDHLEPLNPYGRSKHRFDLWARDRGVLDRIVGLKYFNVYGPNEYHKGEMRSVVIKAYEQAVESGAVRLFRSYRPDFADGEQVRDFLWIGDAVAMTLFFLDHPEANGIFNVGAGVERTWNDLARAVFDALGRPVRITYIEMPEEIRERYQYRTRASIERIRAAGCAAPITPLEEGVRRYVRDFLLPGRLRLGEST